MCSLEFRARGMVSLSVGAGLPSAAPDDARAGRSHGAGLAGWCLYPLARGCRAPRRMTPELAATAPAIPVWRYRLVAGAAEFGGSVADRGASNNAVRGIRRVCSLEFRAGGMVSLSVGAGLPSAAPDVGAGLPAAPRRMTPELAATAPAIPVWRYRLVAGAAELGGSVADRGACNNAVRGIRRVCSGISGWQGWCLYPLARGCRAPRRMTPELAATAPAIPVWRYRLVAGAAELGGSVADRGACNNAVRICACVYSGISGWRDGVCPVRARGLPSAAPDDARASGHGAGDSCLALSAGGRRGGARR